MKILGLILLFVLTTNVAITCTCTNMPLSVNKILNFELVFEGTVVSKNIIDPICPNDSLKLLGDEFAEFNFKINRIIRGKLEVDSILIHTNSIYGTSCGVNYDLGTKLIVFAYKNDDKYYTSLCSQNIEIEYLKRNQRQIIEDYLNSTTNRTWYDEFGKMVAKGKVFEGKPVGKWFFFDQYEILKSSGRFKRGQKSGKWKKFTSKDKFLKYYKNVSGKTLSRILQDESVMITIEYYKKGQLVRLKELY